MQNLIKHNRIKMRILFITHNKNNIEEQLELFRNTDTINYVPIACETSLGVLKSMGVKLIYRSIDKWTIQSHDKIEEIITLNEGMKIWKNLSRPKFA